ncbi:hypothetical protein AMECASPLE_000906 [Ameca splendens]|uniref:Uncharacterized protein n=1 Tax=Ameca splendens TaxID=208324 RepID=A0ABV0Y8R6_9TELE
MSCMFFGNGLGPSVSHPREALDTFKTPYLYSASNWEAVTPLPHGKCSFDSLDCPGLEVFFHLFQPHLLFVRLSHSSPLSLSFSLLLSCFSPPCDFLESCLNHSF